jgi:hypothetical protein
LYLISGKLRYPNVSSPILLYADIPISSSPSQSSSSLLKSAGVEWRKNGFDYMSMVVKSGIGGNSKGSSGA